MQLSFVEGRNRMKLCNKISKGVAKGAEVICMLTIAALVLVIVVELLRRNFLGQSFGGNVQLCGILFLWMAFIGLIPLYRDSGLMRLDFLVARTKGPVYEVLSFPIPGPYPVQYVPMCLAGAYMALESLRQMAEHVAEKARGSRAQV